MAHPDVVDLAHLFLELVQDAHVGPQVGLALQLRDAVLVRLQKQNTKHSGHSDLTTLP